MSDFLIQPPQELVARYTRDGFWTDAVLRDALDTWRSDAPGACALLQASGDSVSYDELGTRVDRMAGGLAGLGIGKGDVVGVQLPNSPEFVITYLALCTLGAVMQTIHMPYHGAELEFLLNHSRARGFVCLSQFKDVSPAASAVTLSQNSNSLEHIVALGAPVDGAQSFGQIADSEAIDNVPRADSSDPFLLLYTSGTTADPKGVPHAYRNFLCNSRVSAQALNICNDDVLLSVAPMTHLYGLFVLHLALMSGAASVLLPAFTPPDFASAVAATRATKIFAAPAHFAASLNAGLLDSHDFSSVRFVCLSGSAVPPDLARAVEDKLPNGETIQLWGMSELQAGAYNRPGSSSPDPHLTTGPPSPGTELRVVNDLDEPLAPGEDGRLQVKGPSVFSGYLRNPAANAQAFADGHWFETGDTARITEHGELAITGRVKEIINRGGVKFNPIDVEAVIDSMASVERSAVVPYPDEVLGERACAFIVARDDAEVSLDDISASLSAAGIAKFKWPERLEFIDAMPLTPTQKVMRGRLTALLAQG
jgi:acyl-CoA synthetase (AMP-forming)/AMP-acid ligase II